MYFSVCIKLGNYIRISNWSLWWHWVWPITKSDVSFKIYHLMI